MGIDDQPEGFSQKGWGCLSEADGHRHIVLRSIAVQLPVYVNATLIGRQRITVLFAVEVGQVDVTIGLLTACRFCYVPYSGIGQQLTHS